MSKWVDAEKDKLLEEKKVVGKMVDAKKRENKRLEDIIEDLERENEKLKAVIKNDQELSEKALTDHPPTQPDMPNMTKNYDKKKRIDLK